MIQQPSKEDVARLLFERGRSVQDARTWEEANVEMREWLKGHAAAVLALFAPILAEKERVERALYSIREPEVGWRSHGSFSPEEKAKLRPVAETLAMLDGNAFFGNEVSAGAEWYEQYLPEAHALYEGNGGDSGWAGEASFAKPDDRALAAEAALAGERERVLALVEDACATPTPDFAGMELDAFHRGADAMNEAIAAAIRKGSGE